MHEWGLATYRTAELSTITFNASEGAPAKTNNFRLRGVRPPFGSSTPSAFSILSDMPPILGYSMPCRRLDDQAVHFCLAENFYKCQCASIGGFQREAWHCFQQLQSTASDKHSLDITASSDHFFDFTQWCRVNHLRILSDIRAWLSRDSHLSWDALREIFFTTRWLAIASAGIALRNSENGQLDFQESRIHLNTNGQVLRMLYQQLEDDSEFAVKFAAEHAKFMSRLELVFAEECNSELPKWANNTDSWYPRTLRSELDGSPLRRTMVEIEEAAPGAGSSLSTFEQLIIEDVVPPKYCPH